MACFACVGITRTEHATLVTAMGGEERGCSLVFLVNDCMEHSLGRVGAQPQHKQFLYVMATKAPVAHLLKPAIVPVISSLLAGESMHCSHAMSLQEHSPVLAQFLQSSLYRPGALTSDMQTLLRTLMEAADQCFDVQPPRASSRALPTHTSATSSRLGDHDEPNDGSSLVHPARDAHNLPVAWGREESFVRTGAFSSLGPEDWQPSALGGNDVYRQLRDYRADGAMGSCREPMCTKYASMTYKLIPGLTLVWCTCCELCVYFSIMPVAESPRTLMEALYTRWPEAPEQVCYDNGCNLHHFCLSREPEYFKNTRFLIDEMHFNDHKKCSPNYSTKLYPKVRNSPLAEQKNSFLRLLASQSAYMSQITFLHYTRYFIHRLNKLQRMTNDGKCFWKDPRV